MGSRNEDRSFSTMGASGVAIAPHIRDALEQARLALLAKDKQSR